MMNYLTSCSGKIYGREGERRTGKDWSIGGKIKWKCGKLSTQEMACIWAKSRGKYGNKKSI
uniref:Uncharacterized protein n=1 Tax=Strigamia maritima TaxID=126957 RepID=T1IQX7_STRMM